MNNAANSCKTWNSHRLHSQPTDTKSDSPASGAVGARAQADLPKTGHLIILSGPSGAGKSTVSGGAYLPTVRCRSS
ncbi:MAG: hypothetical protein R3C56_29040 [Pirellulaceae bacterium]